MNVIVSVSRYGHKYLKTEADGEHPDNLLSFDPVRLSQRRCIHGPPR